MEGFTLKPNDIEINISPEKEKEVVKLTLSMFDGDWVRTLTGIDCTFNKESKLIKETVSKIEALRDICGEINNSRVSEWQRKYFDHQSRVSDSKRTEETK